MGKVNKCIMNESFSKASNTKQPRVEIKQVLYTTEEQLDNLGNKVLL
jgi:hypothetical protein